MAPRSLLFCVLLAAPAAAQSVKTATVEAPVLPISGINGGTAITPLVPNASLTLSPSAALVNPALTLSAATVLPVSAVPVDAKAKSAASAVTPTAKIATTGLVPTARVQLDAFGSKTKLEGVDAGRETFDGGTLREGAGAVRASAANENVALDKPTPRAAEPERAIPLRQRAAEIAEVGAMTLGLSFLGAILLAGVKAAGGMPWIGGLFWGLGGSALIGHLGDMRSIVIGGWQASHDQRYRVDWSSGKLRDVRGHKYGEDRYEERERGPVSKNESIILNSVSFAAGLGLQALIWSADPKSLAIYALGFGGALLARRAWRRLNPPKPSRAPKDAAELAERFYR